MKCPRRSVFLGSSCHFHRKVKGIQKSRTTEFDVILSLYWKTHHKTTTIKQFPKFSKTLKETQGLLMTKLKKCFTYWFRCLRKLSSVEFTATVLGLVIVLGIYRRFGKAWSTPIPHLSLSILCQAPSYQWGHPSLLEDSLLSPKGVTFLRELVFFLVLLSYHLCFQGQVRKEKEAKAYMQTSLVLC